MIDRSLSIFLMGNLLKVERIGHNKVKGERLKVKRNKIVVRGSGFRAKGKALRVASFGSKAWGKGHKVKEIGNRK